MEEVDLDTVPCVWCHGGTWYYNVFENANLEEVLDGINFGNVNRIIHPIKVNDGPVVVHGGEDECGYEEACEVDGMTSRALTALSSFRKVSDILSLRM
jgi:hypothetical protein